MAVSPAAAGRSAIKTAKATVQVLAKEGKAVEIDSATASPGGIFTGVPKTCSPPPGFDGDAPMFDVFVVIFE